MRRPTSSDPLTTTTAKTTTALAPHAVRLRRLHALLTTVWGGGRDLAHVCGVVDTELGGWASLNTGARVDLSADDHPEPAVTSSSADDGGGGVAADPYNKPWSGDTAREPPNGTRRGLSGILLWDWCTVWMCRDPGGGGAAPDDGDEEEKECALVRRVLHGLLATGSGVHLNVPRGTTTPLRTPLDAAVARQSWPLVEALLDLPQWCPGIVASASGGSEAGRSWRADAATVLAPMRCPPDPLGAGWLTWPVAATTATDLPHAPEATHPVLHVDARTLRLAMGGWSDVAWHCVAPRHDDADGITSTSPTAATTTTTAAAPTTATSPMAAAANNPTTVIALAGAGGDGATRAHRATAQRAAALLERVCGRVAWQWGADPRWDGSALAPDEDDTRTVALERGSGDGDGGEVGGGAARVQYAEQRQRPQSALSWWRLVNRCVAAGHRVLLAALMAVGCTPPPAPPSVAVTVSAAAMAVLFRAGSTSSSFVSVATDEPARPALVPSPAPAASSTLPPPAPPLQAPAAGIGPGQSAVVWPAWAHDTLRHVDRHWPGSVVLRGAKGSGDTGRTRHALYRDVRYGVLPYTAPYRTAVTDAAEHVLGGVGVLAAVVADYACGSI